MSRPSLSQIGILVVAALGAATTLRAQALRLEFDGTGGLDGAGFITALGDVDGDGADDFAIGAPYEPNSDGYVGVVRVRSGATGVVLHELRGGSSAQLFGFALASAGDVTGDGIEDLVVGDPFDDTFGASAGRYSVYSGADGSRYYTGTAGGFSLLGFSVAGLGDLDGDGSSEVAIASLGGEVVKVVDGNNGTYATFSGQPGGMFGFDVSAAGDVDADGVPDLIIGEHLFDAGGRNGVENGRALVYSGRTAALIWDLRGGGTWDHFGYSVDGIGDVDGDGHSDLLVGCYGDDTNGSEAGKATVFSGQTGLELYTLYGAAAGDRYGFWLAGVGDMDGDGTPDLAIAAPHAGFGRVTTCSGKDGTKFHDYDHSSDYEWGMVDGGDFDGDGDADLMLGNPNGGPGVSGRVEVYETSIAAWTNYGAGWAGTNGVPGIYPFADPVIGQDVSVKIENSLGATTTALLLLGLDDASVPTSKGGTILVTPFMTVVLVLGKHGTTLTDTLPDDPALCDLHVYLQALEVDPGASKGLSFTPGLDLTLGYDYP
jgi:hypothetical protein